MLAIAGYVGFVEGGGDDSSLEKVAVAEWVMGMMGNDKWVICCMI